MDIEKYHSSIIEWIQFLLSILSIMLNLIVIIKTFKNKQGNNIQFNITFILILASCLINLLLPTFSISQHIISIISNDNFLNNVIFCQSLGLITTLIPYLSVCLTTILTIHKYQHIQDNNNDNNSNSNKKRYIIYFLISIILGIILSVLPIINKEYIITNSQLTCYFNTNMSILGNLWYIYWILFMSINLLMIVIFHLKCIIYIRNKNKRLSKPLEKLGLKIEDVVIQEEIVKKPTATFNKLEHIMNLNLKKKHITTTKTSSKSKVSVLFSLIIFLTTYNLIYIPVILLTLLNLFNVNVSSFGFIILSLLLSFNTLIDPILILFLYPSYYKFSSTF
ncbi:hypothetical protein K502DRAFT_350813 [Neoconidiobolus thromboides FSU 785]|nr:hypothetical protein K502DRAFT_350813 [Neoconidiobolus thromboides FSU 785]